MKFLAAAITLLSSIGINAYQQCKLETEDLLQTGIFITNIQELLSLLMMGQTKNNVSQSDLIS